tara:strand:- start:951 stop:1238 length:288 start_codon:yes stop_codon:yes gene_type:complete
MKLLTKSLENKLLKNATKKDGKAYVKWFNPTGVGTWYVSEMDENGICYGLSCVHEKEFGYFDKKELEELKLPFGLGIERDLWFDPTPLEDCKNLA